MSTLLRRLLHRHCVLCAPAGEDGGGGGTAADDIDPDLDDDPGADADPDGGAANDGEGDGQDDDDEIIVTIGEAEQADDDDESEEDAIAEALGDAPSSSAFARIRKAKTDLKRQLKDVQRQRQEDAQRVRDLEEQVKTLHPIEKTIEVGAEPNLDNYVDEYDTLTPEKKAQFRADHDAWKQRKADADAQKSQRETAQQQQQQQWMSRIQAVDDAANGMKVAGDKQAAVKAFETTFSIVQRGIIMGALDQPETSAMMRHALGSNALAARKLAAINDPVKFAVAVGELKMQMKITKGKKGAPAPDKRLQSGKTGVSVTGDQLARLRAEADKTGDRSKVSAYIREQNRKSA